MADDQPRDDLFVGPDGTVYERVWHGAKVNPVTGVKGGLMEYPHREEQPDPADVPVTVVGEEETRPPSVVAVRCPVCRTDVWRPRWLARRLVCCSRRCGQAYRNARRGEKSY